MQTLEDYLNYDLSILSIGLNPSTISVERGFYFANPRNRFWKALNASALINEKLVPSAESQEKLLLKYKIGFTDIVKRHSSMGKDLTAADYKKWVPVTESAIKKYRPKICWFHGKVAMQKYLQYGAEKKKSVSWGLQDFEIATAHVFVTPNPSPANAAFSLEVLIEWYQALHALHCEINK